jgi:hypothetical protein
MTNMRVRWFTSSHTYYNNPNSLCKGPSGVHSVECRTANSLQASIYATDYCEYLLFGRSEARVWGLSTGYREDLYQ